MSTIGQRIKDLASNKGINLKELSEISGIPYRSIQNYASDKQQPGAEVLVKLQETVDVDLNWLLIGHPFTPSQPKNDDGKIDLVVIEEIGRELIREIKKYQGMGVKHLISVPREYYSALIYNKVIKSIRVGENYNDAIKDEITYLLSIIRHNDKEISPPLMHEEEQEYLQKLGADVNEVAGEAIANPIEKTKTQTTQNFNDQVGQVAGRDIVNPDKDKK